MGQWESGIWQIQIDNQSALKYISNVTHIAVADKYCVIVKTGECTSQGGGPGKNVSIVHLCNDTKPSFLMWMCHRTLHAYRARSDLRARSANTQTRRSL